MMWVGNSMLRQRPSPNAVAPLPRSLPSSTSSFGSDDAIVDVSVNLFRHSQEEEEEVPEVVPLEAFEALEERPEEDHQRRKFWPQKTSGKPSLSSSKQRPASKGAVVDVVDVVPQRPVSKGPGGSFLQLKNKNKPKVAQQQPQPQSQPRREREQLQRRSSHDSRQSNDSRQSPDRRSIFPSLRCQESENDENQNLQNRNDSLTGSASASSPSSPLPSAARRTTRRRPSATDLDIAIAGNIERFESLPAPPPVQVQVVQASAPPVASSPFSKMSPTRLFSARARGSHLLLSRNMQAHAAAYFRGAPGGNLGNVMEGVGNPHGAASLMRTGIRRAQSDIPVQQMELEDMNLIHSLAAGRIHPHRRGYQSMTDARSQRLDDKRRAERHTLRFDTQVWVYEFDKERFDTGIEGVKERMSEKERRMVVQPPNTAPLAFGAPSRPQVRRTRGGGGGGQPGVGLDYSMVCSYDANQ